MKFQSQEDFPDKEGLIIMETGQENGTVPILWKCQEKDLSAPTYMEGSSSHQFQTQCCHYYLTGLEQNHIPTPVLSTVTYLRSFLHIEYNKYFEKIGVLIQV